MRRVALALAAVAAIGLSANLATAGEKHSSNDGHASITLVGHHGHHGHRGPHHRGPSYGHHGSRHRYHHGPRHHYFRHPPVIVHPPVYRSPPYYRYRYYNPYYPRGGVSYYGRGFGFSFGF
jgi:hypothetical protein